ncbi:hypothetical protein Q4520_18135 [Alteromonas sp. 1_MG-2023]|uniref:hypothetical protein n=1 Tax=Alteromonas sp. 1_MG-2023 TaxID=3062669 RepID=UPI0026E1EFC7|nr:hypothetical protein [Alteromonas sp. 1_MG-2023]MDO6477346.1 hypothetical protein [Alteromonas sp. 1_MG-2023]
MTKLIFIFVFPFFTSFAAFAEEPGVSVILKEFCAEKHSYKTKYLKRFAAATQAIRDDYCSIDPDIADVRDALVLAVISSASEFDAIDDKSILRNGGVFDIEIFQSVLANTPLSQGLPTFNSQRVGSNELDLNIGNALRQQIDITKCDTALKTQFPEGNCLELFNDFENLYNFAHMTVSSPIARKVWDIWDKAETDWTHYFDNGRSQMPWEYAANYALWSRTKEAGKVGTPLDYQIILLHPSVVIENISGAIDGQNTKEGLMLEVVGINFWRSDNWYEPTGASFVSVYADRAQIRDWGWGVAVHFDNTFTIGATRRDDETGLFLSVDLWQAFMDKKTKMEKIRSRVLDE